MAAAKRIKILDDLKHLMRPLHTEERAALVESLRRDGCREPLSVWDLGAEHVLLDGHNRYEICKELGIPFKRKVIEDIKSLDDAERWMIANQLARRNISPNEKAYLIGLRYTRNKTQGARSDLYEVDGDTAASLAQEFHVSDRAIRAMGQFAEAVDVLDETLQAKARILHEAIPLSRDEVIFIASQPDEEHRDLWARALASRQDLQKIMKAREATKRGRLRTPRLQPKPSAAEQFDIADLVRIIATHWPVGRVADVVPDYRQANILDQYLDAAIASLRCLKRARDEEEFEASAKMPVEMDNAGQRA
jgi:ParB-like chromosome segregation protein Spo0J